MIGDLAEKHGREDGFMHRLLLSYPNASIGPWADYEPSAAAVKAHDEIFEKLSRFPAEYRYTREPRYARFDEQAKKLFVDYQNQLTEESRSLSPSLRGPWAKFRGYLARLALVLHLAYWAAGEEKDTYLVGSRAVKGAIRLIDYFKSHARRVYSRLEASEGDRDVLKAVDWIRQKGGEASARDIYSAKVGGCRNAKAARGLLERLVNCGYGEVLTLKPPGGGRASTVFRLADKSVDGDHERDD